MNAQVSIRALEQRINRKLNKEEERLCRAREGSMLWSNFGRYYLYDWRRNRIIAQHIDIEELGREIRVLGEWEQVRPDK